MTLPRLLLVFVGGAIGTAFRLTLSLLIPDAVGLPVSTLAVNVAGAFLIGVLAVRPFDRLRDREGRLRDREGLSARSGRLEGADVRVFLGTGILGGFTTYSAFAVGTVELWSETPLLAVVYALLTLVLGVAAAILGMRLGRPRRSREETR